MKLINNTIMKSFAATLAVVLATFFTAQAQIAIKANTVHTIAGETIENGVVLVNNGEIEEVGSENDVDIPSDYEVHEGEVVTPGLIDAHTVVGLSGILNVDADQDQLETSSPIQPHLRAIDAYNATEDLVKFLMNKGVTTVHTGHGPGALASGQTMIAKTGYDTVEDAVLDSTTMVAFTLGSGVSQNFSSPGTRSKGVAMLRQKFIDAQSYAEKRADGELSSTNLEMETLADIIDGKVTALVTAQTAGDIMNAIRLQEEFDIPMVLDGAAEAYRVMDEIKESGIPVIVHPTKARIQNASFETPADIAEAEIPFAFQSGYEGYVPKSRVILFEAGIAVANGMDTNTALHALTLGAAELLDIDDRVGSLESGKDADIVVYDGDPFEYTTHVTNVVIDGELVK